MKVYVALILALASILVSIAHGEYRVKIHPQIPPPPLPSFKIPSSVVKGGGHRWTSNSLGPPRLHHYHHHPPSFSHHHIPHGPTLSVHHHSGPSPPKSILRPVHGAHFHSSHSHAPIPHSHSLHSSHPPHSHPPHPPGPILHLHHHHIPSSNVLRPSFKTQWKGPSGNIGVGHGKDTFHPSPPDGVQTIVATHQTVDDNKGPIHTIPAPNLGPSGKHPHLQSLQGSGFQTGHGIGQGAGDAGGPYPNPVYGKPVTADLTYHEPKVPAHLDTNQSPKIPTIKIQSSHGYQVHEHFLDSHVTPAPVLPQVTTHGVGTFFAPDPDPSIPAPKVPYPLDPYSHPSNGHSPPDLEQGIPEHLLTLYGFNQQNQNVHLQPQLPLQEHHQTQISNVGIQGAVVNQGGYVPTDLGGQILLAQALAQYDSQTQPEAFNQVSIQQHPGQHSSVQLIPSPTPTPFTPLSPELLQPYGNSKNPTSVSLQQVPLVASSHETVYQPINSQQLGSVSDGQGGHLSAYDLFANSPVNSPVLDSLKEDFHNHYPSTTPAPVFSAGGGHLQYHGSFTSTVAPPPQVPENSVQYGHQQQYFSTTIAPPVLPVANQIEYQRQTHGYNQAAVSTGQGVSEIYHNLGAAALANHQAQAVKVSNPGQAGYISTSYHNQLIGNVAAPQVQTQVYNYGHDSFSAETRHKASSVEPSEVNSLVNSVEHGSSSVTGSLRTGGVETVRPSSSSSFYSETAVKGGSQGSNDEEQQEEDEDYYDEDVLQEVGPENDKRLENPQPALPSSYSVYESYDESPKQSAEEGKNDQEYDDNEGQFDDYSTQTKTDESHSSSAIQEEQKTPTRNTPTRSYDRNVEFGTRIRPKKNN